MSRAAEPLLMIPGLLCSPDLFWAQVTGLGRDRPVLVADHTVADRVEAIAGAILATAPDRFALAGLSMGGYVALAMCERHPERVRSLTLVDTRANADDEQALPPCDRFRLGNDRSGRHRTSCVARL